MTLDPKQLTDIASELRSLADRLDAMTNSQPIQPVTLEQLRAVLAEKSRDGLTDAVRALLISHGADRLSDIHPAHYADLLREAEVLQNG